MALTCSFQNKPMSIHADKTRNRQIKASAVNRPAEQSRSKSTFPLADNRVQTGTQRELQEGIENSSQVQQLKFLQENTGNSPQANRSSQIKAMANDCSSSQPIYQRMAVMAVDNMKDQRDALVWNNLDYALKQAPGSVGDLKSNKVWSDLHKGETIRIVEHGEVRKLGNVDANKIVNSMKKPPNKLKTGLKISKVVFQSCYSRMKEKGTNESLVSDMRNELNKIPGQENVPVEGSKGIAFGFEGMGERVARTSQGSYIWQNEGAKKVFDKLPKDIHSEEKGMKAYLDAMFSLQNETTKGGNEVFKSLFIYNDPWIIGGIKEDDWKNNNDVKNRRKQMAKISVQMAPYWKKLAETMGSYGGFRPSLGKFTFLEPMLEKVLPSLF